MGRRRSYKSYFKFRLKPKTIMTALGIICLAAAGLVALSFFGESPLLGVLNQKVVEVFGWASLFLPLLLGSLSLIPFWARRRGRRADNTHIPVGLSLLLLSLLGLTAPFSEEKAGLIGRELWFNLSDLITGLGGGIFLLATATIGVTVLFNTSLDELLGSLIKVLQGLKAFGKEYLWRGVFSKKRLVFIQKGLSPKSEKQKVLEEKPGTVKAPVPRAPLKKPADLQPVLVSNLPTESEVWRYPPLSLLSESTSQPAERGDIKQNAAVIEKTLDSFGIEARVVEVNLGPAVTQYCLEIALGTKLSKITNLSNDLALALAAPTGQIRIEAPIPGRSLVGVEIPNRTLEFVTLKSILTSDKMQKATSKLTVGLGLDVSGNPVVADIARMPHVLIAGATGSGKTVCLNSFIASLLFRTTPSEVKLILVDPKRVEMTHYNGILHLLTPVIVDIDKTLSALKWAIAEMDRRYKLFANAGARNIDAYNEMSGFHALPSIVIFIDELADLMAFAPVEFEDAITRLAQMSRATGIHLVISTQRPSVDVITGLIKANIPCRIAFNVSSMVDSRVIIDMPGAEKLLGRGDMLYIPPEQAKPTRIQGAFVSDGEIKQLVEYLRNQGAAPQYTEEVTQAFAAKIVGPGVGEEKDKLFEDAVRTVCQYDRASASLLQRRLKIGYARAARILDQLEAAGIVGPAEGAKPRDVLIRNAEEFLAQQATESEI